MSTENPIIARDIINNKKFYIFREDGRQIEVEIIEKNFLKSKYELTENEKNKILELNA